MVNLWSKMTGCCPSSLFVSEVLVILSSCVFVVMALLTAVVSVTNITFTDKTDRSSSGLHCHLPHRYTINSTFDIPSYYSYLFENSAVSSFVSFLFSTLRSKLIQKHVIFPNQYLEYQIEELIDQLMNLTNSFNSNFDITNIPLYYLFYLGLNNNSDLYPSLVLPDNKTIEFPFQMKSPIFLYDIEQIKTKLINTSIPIVLSIPFNLSQFYEKLANPSNFFLQDSSITYFIYGWSDDFILKRPNIYSNFQQQQNDIITGGFIVKQFENIQFGHSLPYFYGNFSSYEEELMCPNSHNPFNFPFIDSQVTYLPPYAKLKCNNPKKCNENLTYYLIESENDYSVPEIIEYQSSVEIGFLQVDESEPLIEKRKIYIEFEKFEDFINSFSLMNQNDPETCSFLFLPYSIIRKAFAISKTIEQSVYGIFAPIRWKIGKELNLSLHALQLPDRPKPYYEV